ncbi:tetratricopeptide repeat-containing sensor histidine kinase [Polaribacter cellanae]|uniref:histidine kinase n=1 Tax=Polaribacter cellanae TaxID=2818493 RepID=A0A975CKT8_9FLAO|nr:ATP-binding protein [Polaribacter cellanae]QTE21503.1 tetratricopeptide repeat protein [Polaribacter cellanae]
MKLVKQPFVFSVCCFFCISLIAQTKKELIKLHQEFNETVFTDFNKALKNATIAVSLSKKIKDKSLLLTSYSNLSEIFYLKKETDSAYMYNASAITLALDISDKEQLAKRYNLLGSIEKRRNNYSESLKNYERALKLAHQNSKSVVFNIKNNLARLYWATGDKINAKKSLQEALKQDYSIYKNEIADAYNILGVICLEKNKDSSLVYYNKAYYLANSSRNNYLKSTITSNLGYLYLYLNDYPKSLKYLKESEILSEEIHDKSSLHYINISLGIYYERKGDLKNAIKKYKKAIEEYGSYVDDYQKSKAYWTVSGVFYHSKKYKDAYLYLDAFLELNEKILNLEKKKEFERIRIQYEVEKKENKIALLEKENEVAKVRKKNILISFISTLILITVFILFYRNKMKKQKQLEKIHQFLAGQEKEKNRIALELHDGIGGELAGIKHILTAVNSNIENTDIKKVTENITLITNEVRLLSHTLSANYILKTPFTHLILELKNTFEISKNIEINIHIYPKNSINELTANKKHHLYRILQELIHNSCKHSKCKRIDLSFTNHIKYLSLIIEDDGIGFNVENKVDGIGLLNIKERVYKMNGFIKIESIIDKGTLILVKIPHA